MKVLTINAGSSSLKYTLFRMDTEELMASGQVERIGLADPRLSYKPHGGTKTEEVISVKNHTEALNAACAKLIDPKIGVMKSFSEVKAIGHRVLHGGERISRPVIVDQSVKRIIAECIPLGPLHNPANLAGIEVCEQIFPGVPNVAVFDTAFHQTMPPEAYLYAIPHDLYEKYSIRRYGFHGTSHHFVSEATAKFLDRPLDSFNLITCHLGNGSSIAAVEKGKVVDTSMGMTPLEGLVMGTRSGDIDPAAVLRITDKMGMTPAEADAFFNKKCGLLGLSGSSSDMREIISLSQGGDERAQLALKSFVRRVVKYIGAYAALMNGVDAIAFTGGIGEYSVPVREKVISSLSFFGVELDKDANSKLMGKPGFVSTPASKVKAIVMPTNEELMIGRQTRDLLKKSNLI